MSWQALQFPQWSVSGSSGGRSAAVKISPRNSQEPNSRDTKLVCLPCQPRPAAAASGFSITGAVSTKTLRPSAGSAFYHDLVKGRLKTLASLDEVMVVAIAGVDRDRAFRLVRKRGARVLVGTVIHAQHD